MKRILMILLCSAMLLNMTACSKTPQVTVQTTRPEATFTQPTETADPTFPTDTQPSQTTVPTEPEQTEPVIPSWQIPLTAIAMPQTQEMDTTETGEAVFTYTYPDITFLHQDAEVARTVLLNLRNRVEAYRSEAESMKAKAGSIVETTGKAPNHSLSITCEAMRVDQSILSVLLTQELRSDTDMGIASVQAVTYDLVSGKPMTLSQLLAEDASSDQLRSMLADILSHTDGIYSWYSDILSELFTGNTLPENWYLSAEGLCFYFIPYEIAPYSMEVTIPYGALNGVIRDRYYPPEIPQTAGTVEAVHFEDADLSRFSSFAEVVLSPIDNAFLFYTNGTVSHLRIRQATCDSYPDTFTEGDVIFATDTLCAGQAVRVQTYSESLFYVLHISYISNGQSVSAYYFPNLIGLEDPAYIVQIDP